jgi:multiple sugar transport system ATP-binding protein
MAEVVFHNVRKRYGDTLVIGGLDLAVKDGEFMVLVGPSGCGKSTALRMLAGLEEITGGEIRIGERVVNDLEPKDRDIAMVFQSYALYPHMSVRENMDFGLRIKRMDRAEIDRRIEDAVRILGLEDYLERKPRQLSGGQRQRVAVGRAIVRQPAVFLFDEPLSNLDAKLRVQMRAEIIALQRRLGTTTIYVTHDQVEAMTMGHRIAVLKDGDLQQVGPPLEVYDRPANLFVARFIGTPPMNVLRGVVEGTTVRCAETALPVPDHLAPALAGRDGKPVLVGIRPEHVDVAPPADGLPAVALTVRVILLETLGHEIVLHGEYGDGDGLETLAAKTAPGALPAVGGQATLQLDPAHLHLFDPDTERRLEA